MAVGGTKLTYHLVSCAYIRAAVVSWRMFDKHATARLCACAAPRAGSSTPIRIAIIPITTSSSTCVNARRLRIPLHCIKHPERVNLFDERRRERSDHRRAATVENADAMK